MYDPVKDGIEKHVSSVFYSEAKPPDHLADLVQCYWELKTLEHLKEDFLYHVLPDACVNILLDQINIEIAAVTALNGKYKILNLGKEFHYVGIQLIPGVWRGNSEEIIRDLVDQPYIGNLPILKTNLEIKDLDFVAQQKILTELVEVLIAQTSVAKNLVTLKILQNISEIQSVADMASVVKLSPRQLQRTLKQSTGFSPHDFLKILRMQLSFKQHYLTYYSDQSHFIHSFQKITGYTPAQYIKKFDV